MIASLAFAARNKGFSLIELLAAMGVVSILLAIMLAALGRGRALAEETHCRANLRALGQAALLYANEHEGEFPRSKHSARGANTRPWNTTIQPYLGYDSSMTGDEVADSIERHCRCPKDERESHSSYGLNVYVELDLHLNPSDYGSGWQGETWRTLASMPAPNQTILFAELKSGENADHVMAHFWTGNTANAEVAIDRHGGKANYAFVDGHVELLLVESVFDASNGINKWNPATAGN
ncbi:MAG: prepilin-type N-terminal cleavage/methylation domain-containing protein [Verrucomicrobiota bacterium]